MRSRREMLELVKTDVVMNHKDYYAVYPEDYYVIHPEDLPMYAIDVRNRLRRYRVYNDINIRSAVRCVDLRLVSSNAYELGYKSNAELISSYRHAQYGMQIPYSTLNKKLRYL